MSATINAKKLKFAVWGHGFENVRNDSGTGAREPDYHDLSGMNLACIDETGTYVWLSDEGNWLHKIKIDTWEFQSNSLPVGSIYHPSNVENNLGVITYGLGNNAKVVIFDLTTNEVIKEISDPYSRFFGIGDCVLNGDDIYLIKCSPQNSTSTIIKIDMANEEISEVEIGNVCVCGFVDEDTAYTFWQKIWFSDNSQVYGRYIDGSVQWYTTEDTYHGYPFAVRLQGLCGNGYLYVPMPKDGGYTLGVFDGNTTPDFVTPLPIRTFGSFNDLPDLQWQYSRVDYCYNQGRTKACFATTIGTFYTDFQTVKKLSDTAVGMQPLAMNDRIVVSRVGNNQVSVYYL